MQIPNDTMQFPYIFHIHVHKNHKYIYIYSCDRYFEWCFEYSCLKCINLVFVLFLIHVVCVTGNVIYFNYSILVSVESFCPFSQKTYHFICILDSEQSDSSINSCFNCINLQLFSFPWNPITSTVVHMQQTFVISYTILISNIQSVVTPISVLSTLHPNWSVSLKFNLHLSVMSKRCFSGWECLAILSILLFSPK